LAASMVLTASHAIPL